MEEREDDLKHYGVRGMKWDEDKKTAKQELEQLKKLASKYKLTPEQQKRVAALAKQLAKGKRKLVNTTNNALKDLGLKKKNTADKMGDALESVGLKKKSKIEKAKAALAKRKRKIANETNNALKDLGLKKKNTADKVGDALESVGLKKKSKIEKAKAALAKELAKKHPSKKHLSKGLTKKLEKLGISKKKRTVGDKLNDAAKTVFGVSYPKLMVNGVEVNSKTLKPLNKNDTAAVREQRDREAALKRTLRDLGLSDKTIKGITKKR
jgi:Holliday junction resolvase-like predicted endonuclease